MAISFTTEDEKPYGCFCNSCDCWFELDDLYWQTVDHYYQAQKFTELEYFEKIRMSRTADIARDLGKTNSHLIRPDWDDIKDEVMRKAIYAKFSFNLRVRETLLSTHNEPIFFRSDDPYWGTGEDGKGLNKMGQILMQTRDALQLIAENPFAIQCGHQNTEEYRRVCIHILFSEITKLNLDYYQRYTVGNVNFDAVCSECVVNPDLIDNNLRKVCPRCFMEYINTKPMGIIGEPAHKERKSSIHFQQVTTILNSVLPEGIVAVQPSLEDEHGNWIVLTKHKEIFKYDTEKNTFEKLFDIPDATIDWEKPLSFQISKNGRFLAIVNQRGQHGIIYDRTFKRATIQLDRKDYHTDVCNFSIGFFEQDNRTLLIHATDWNRLDISDPETGQLLTNRGPIVFTDADTRPDHYLDYFHCGLLISPDHRWVADNGWIWHPVGAVRTWDMNRWTKENKWESEDGPSVKVLLWRDYYWDGPICWIDNKHIAIWGIGEDDFVLIPGIRIFNVIDGTELPPIYGPLGDLIYDQYLFAVSSEIGTTVWDVLTGERLHIDRNFHPKAYHPRSKQFLVTLEENKVVMGYVTE